MQALLRLEVHMAILVCASMVHLTEAIFVVAVLRTNLSWYEALHPLNVTSVLNLKSIPLYSSNERQLASFFIYCKVVYRSSSRFILPCSAGMSEETLDTSISVSLEILHKCPRIEFFYVLLWCSCWFFEIALYLRYVCVLVSLYCPLSLRRISVFWFS